MAEIRSLEYFATNGSTQAWSSTPPEANAPTPAPAAVDTTPTSGGPPMESIPEDGTPDLFEDLQNLPATPTPQTNQSMATLLS
mgnify:CR=1 FL=1